MIGNRRQGHMSIAVKRVVSTERNDMPAGKDVCQATLHDAPYIEIVDIQKRRQGYPEGFLARELLRESLHHELIQRRVSWPAATRTTATSAGAFEVLGNKLPGPLRCEDDTVSN